MCAYRSHRRDSGICIVSRWFFVDCRSISSHRSCRSDPTDAVVQTLPVETAFHTPRQGFMMNEDSVTIQGFRSTAACSRTKVSMMFVSMTRLSNLTQRELCLGSSAAKILLRPCRSKSTKSQRRMESASLRRSDDFPSLDFAKDEDISLIFYTARAPTSHCWFTRMLGAPPSMLRDDQRAECDVLRIASTKMDEIRAQASTERCSLSTSNPTNARSESF